MAGNSPNVARKINILSARDRKVSFSRGELDIENNWEAPIVPGTTRTQVKFDP